VKVRHLCPTTPSGWCVSLSVHGSDSHGLAGEVAADVVAMLEEY